MVFAKGFVDACRAATEQMGKDLKLAPTQEAGTPGKEVGAAVPAAPAVPAPTGAPVYDLRGVACPLNYVKTKLKLEIGTSTRGDVPRGFTRVLLRSCMLATR